MNFNRIKHFFLNHWQALVVAVVVALVAGLPQVMIKRALGPADHGIPYLLNDSESYYISRIHEILDGHISVSSPVFYEYKDSINFILPTGEFLFYVLPMKLLGLSLVTIVFLSRFVYPALLFLLVYLFILSLLNRNEIGAKLSAIAGALLIVIGYDAVSFKSLIYYFLHGTTEATGLLWNRLVNPITGGILLFAFLWLLSRMVHSKGRWPTVIVSATILSLMPGYPFSFALGLMIAVLTGLYFIWRRNWSMVARVYVPVGVALVANGFYFGYIFLVKSHGAFLSDPSKTGMILTHQPLINLFSLAALIGVAMCFIIYFRNDTSSEQEKRWWFFSLATVIGCGLVYNQQVITGIAIWPHHFVQYTKPLVMAVMMVFLHNIFRPRFQNVWRAGVVVVVVIAALCGWRILATVQYNIPQYTDLQSFSGVFDYLNTHAQKDCVVYVSSDYSEVINPFLPGLTGCDVYHSFYFYNGVPAERIMHNYLVDLRLRDIKANEVGKYFTDADNLFFTKVYFYRDWSDIFCCGDPWLDKIGDQKEIDAWFASVGKDVERRYAEYLKGDLYVELMQYRLDYFVVDTEIQPYVNEKNFKFLSLKGKFGRFAVYAMLKP